MRMNLAKMRSPVNIDLPVTPNWCRPVTKFEGSNIPKAARKLKRPDGLYRFRIGKVYTQVWDPSGIKYVVDANGLIGSDVLGAGYTHFEITPHHIVKFIERGFKSATTYVYP